MIFDFLPWFTRCSWFSRDGVDEGIEWLVRCIKRNSCVRPATQKDIAWPQRDRGRCSVLRTFPSDGIIICDRLKPQNAGFVLIHVQLCAEGIGTALLARWLLSNVGGWWWWCYVGCFCCQKYSWDFENVIVGFGDFHAGWNDDFIEMLYLPDTLFW